MTKEGADDMKDEGSSSTPHKFRDTAAGLGLAATQAVLTPVVGLGLMGVAATDAVASGTTGTYHRAKDLIGKTDKDSVDLASTAVNEGEFRRQSLLDDKAALQAAKAASEEMKVEVFDYDTADYKMLRKKYLDMGIPFILRKKDGAPISDAAPPVEDDGTGDAGTIAVLADRLKAKYPGIDEVIRKLLPHTFRPHWPLWFQGNYKSGLAHVDLGPGTCNFYFMKRGKKDVVIAPLETTRNLILKTGIDNLYVPGSSGNHDYLPILDKYYRCTVEEQSILIFNNSGSLHHFTNIVEDGVNPIALSVRCKHAYGSDPRGWLNLAGNLKVWWNMTDHMMALAKKEPDSRKADKA